MIKSNVSSYELVKAIIDDRSTVVDAAGSSNKTTQAFIHKEDILEAATKYTTTKFWVYLDQEGAIKFYREFIANIQDFVAVTFEKYFSDAANSGDFEFLDFLKILDDELVIEDIFAQISDKFEFDVLEQIDEYSISFDSDKQETLVSLDYTSIGIERPLLDLNEVADETSISFSTSYYDAVVQEDASDLSVEKVSADNAQSDDSFARIVDYTRNYSDSVIPVDTIAGLSFTNAESDTAVVDPLGVDDDPAIDIQKAPIEEVSYIDDSSLFSMDMPFADESTSLDTYQQELLKNASDTSLVSEYTYFDFEKFTDESVNQYDDVSVLIEWVRLFEDFSVPDDTYATSFDMGNIDNTVDINDELITLSLEFSREFDDTSTVLDQLSGVVFDDTESDSVAFDPLGVDDDPAFNLDKSPIDLSVSNEDLVILTAEKLIDNTITQNDAINSFSVDKAIEETQPADESTNLHLSTSKTDIYDALDDFFYTLDINRSFDESLSSAETYELLLDKPIYDSQTSSDSTTFDFTKPDISDSYSVNDVIDLSTLYSRLVDDSLSLIDNLSGITFSDAESDSVAFDPLGVDDDPAFNLDKISSDTYSAVDVPALTVILPKQESQSVDDGISAINSNMGLGDSQSQTDQTSRVFTKDSIQESTTETDVFDRTVVYSRTYTDTQTQSDSNSIDFSGGTIQETLSGTDSRIIESYKYFYEMLSEIDSGSLLNTDYIGSYYFADDFVGSKRNF